MRGARLWIVQRNLEAVKTKPSHLTYIGKQEALMPMLRGGSKARGVLICSTCARQD